jgi:hypothetical protein
MKARELKKRRNFAGLQEEVDYVDERRRRPDRMNI